MNLCQTLKLIRKLFSYSMKEGHGKVGKDMPKEKQPISQFLLGLCDTSYSWQSHYNLGSKSYHCSAFS